jgi:hypothetical protein
VEPSLEDVLEKATWHDWSAVKAVLADLATRMLQ